jgi:serine/threonine protein kinase
MIAGRDTNGVGPVAKGSMPPLQLPANGRPSQAFGGRVEPLRPGDPQQIGDPGRVSPPEARHLPIIVEGRLGVGGMGTVYRGTTGGGGYTVAVKVIHPHYADDPAFRRRFATEVASARQVDSLYTARVIAADADPPGGQPWLATEYITGDTLDSRIRGGALSPGDVLRLAAGLAEALSHIHDSGMMHRDLTPRNIILTDNGPKVIDFGIARAADEASSSSGLIGTPHYMAPERLGMPGAVGRPSDIFSLGVVLAVAATGRKPFGHDGADFYAVAQAILFGVPDLGGLNGQVRGIVERCLAKDQQHRPSAGELVTEFRRLRNQGAPVTKTEPPTVPQPRAAPGMESRTTPERGKESKTAPEPTTEPARLRARPGLGDHLRLRASMLAALVLGAAGTAAASWLTTETDWPALLLVGLLTAATCHLVTAVTGALTERRAGG